MQRTDLEHLLRAAGAISAETHIVVIGSQAVLGSLADPPAELLVSLEADLFPLHQPAKADLIDGSIGELSPFHETFGYYAHGVGPETARLPHDWRSRLVELKNENTQGVTGLCLSLADLAISKLAAGRPKDLDYVRCLLNHHLVEASSILELAKSMPEIQLIETRLASCKSPR
jgi:hypothetical protein